MGTLLAFPQIIFIIVKAINANPIALPIELLIGIAISISAAGTIEAISVKSILLRLLSIRMPT